jgi:hypothetical protein
MNETAYNKLVEVMISAGELNDTIPFNQVVDNTYAKNAIEAMQ